MNFITWLISLPTAILLFFFPVPVHEQFLPLNEPLQVIEVKTQPISTGNQVTTKEKVVQTLKSAGIETHELPPIQIPSPIRELQVTIIPVVESPKVEPTAPEPVVCPDLVFTVDKNPNSWFNYGEFSPGGKTFPESKVEVTNVKVSATGLCEEWVIDYEYDSWQKVGDEYVMVRDTVKNAKSGTLVNLENPVEGTHSATFTAHTVDNSKKSEPVTVTFPGGLLSQ